MVVALQVAEAAPRRWFRRRKAEAHMEKIRVGEGAYYRITARPDKRGRLPWEEIRRLAGRGAGRMLLPRGLEAPSGMGIRPFHGELLGQEMMAITAVHLLRVGTAAPGRTTAAVYDPRGRMPQLACALLPYTADVRVVTDRPDLYEEQEAAAMERYGATFLVTGDPGVLHRRRWCWRRRAWADSGRAHAATCCRGCRRRGATWWAATSRGSRPRGWRPSPISAIPGCFCRPCMNGGACGAY